MNLSVASVRWKLINAMASVGERRIVKSVELAITELQEQMKSDIERRVARLEGDQSGPCLYCFLERVGTGVAPAVCPHPHRPTLEELLHQLRGRRQTQSAPKSR